MRIHALNNSLEEYDVILDRLENGLILLGSGVLTFKVMHKKLNHWYKKISVKKLKKKKKLSLQKENITKDITANVVHMIISELTRNVQTTKKKIKKKKRNRKQKIVITKKKEVSQKILYLWKTRAWELQVQKDAKKLERLEKTEKAKKELDKKEDDLVLYTIRRQQIITRKKKRVSFATDVKLINPHSALLSSTEETGMMCIIDGYSFYPITKNIWIANFSTSFTLPTITEVCLM